MAEIDKTQSGTGDRGWNGVRYRAGVGDHVESYFLKLNDPAQERALWLKATIFASKREPERPLAEGWAIFFDRRTNHHVAVKSTRPLDEARFDARTLHVTWPDFSLDASGTRGRIDHKKSSIAWDLRFQGDAPPVVPFFSERMYEMRFPKSKLVTPMPDLTFTGSVTVDGREVAIDGWRGMQGHNWGRGHADLYAWCHCNVWDGASDFILEGVSARVRVGPVMTPLLTLVCVRHRGVRYDFIGPRELVQSRGDVSPRHWSFTAHNRFAHIDGVVEAEGDEMVGLYYANPDGQMTYCLNSKIARARIRFEARGRPALELRSRAAALEIGTKRDDHGVRMYV